MRKPIPCWAPSISRDHPDASRPRPWAALPRFLLWGGLAITLGSLTRADASSGNPEALETGSAWLGASYDYLRELSRHLAVTDIVVTACALVIAWYAWRLSRLTERMWRVAAGQARDLKDAVNVARRSAEVAEEQAQITREAVNVAAEAAAATREAARVTWETAGVMARDNAERQLRAYVFLTSGNIALVNNDTALSLAVDLENSGQTPGHDFTTWAKIEIADGERDAPFGPPTPLEQRPGPSIIPPRSRTLVSGSHPVGPADLQAIRHGGKAIYVWGGCDYRDVFGNARYFEFKSAMTGPEMGGTVAGQPWRGWPLKPHKTGYEGN